MENQHPIYVTQPSLGPLEDFIPYLKEIWSSKIVTNGGPFHNELEKALCDYLHVKHISLFTNGTIALITALQALGISGQVITTPYSFVATAHSLLWNGIEPIFVDIDPETFNLDPKKIEMAITEKTSAIMPVHVYGQPCNIDAIEKIAAQHKLKVIYDAAHAFGVQCHCGSVLNHGDLSVLSFHATKVFNTFEGGAIVCPDAKTKLHIDQLKNFGFIDEVTVDTSGINGKMSEINAAFGLLQLKNVDQTYSSRKLIDNFYRQELKDVKGIRCLIGPDGSIANYGYFPILVDEEYKLSRDELYYKMRDHNIFARRYFYPLISNFPMYKNLPSSKKSNLPVASDAADKILCLPIYPNLRQSDQMIIINLIAGKKVCLN
jgi:dTDP-4-amino-4,6-dideoxygalactose transaminase